MCDNNEGLHFFGASLARHTFLKGVLKMKKLLVKLPFYILILFLFIASTIVFGLVVGGEKLFLIYLCVEFFVSGLIYWFYLKKINSAESLLKVFDYIEIFIFSFVILISSVFIYHSANKISSVYVQEYDTVVTDVHYRYGGKAWFTDPYGEEQFANLNDWRIIIVNDEEIISTGDTIHIKEMRGSFGFNYYVIVDK